MTTITLWALLLGGFGGAFDSGEVKFVIIVQEKIVRDVTAADLETKAGTKSEPSPDPADYVYFPKRPARAPRKKLSAAEQETADFLFINFGY